MLKIVLFIFILKIYYQLNLFEFGTSTCVSNNNIELNLKEVAKKSKKCTNIDGTLDNEKISHFNEPYKTAFQQASLLLPNNCSIANITYPYNTNYDNRRMTSNLEPLLNEFPYLIYTIRNENQISRAIILINYLFDDKVKISVHNGPGHDYKGYSSVNQTINFQIQYINNITINNDYTTIIESGNSLLNVYIVLFNSGYTTTLGYSKDVHMGIYLNDGV